MVVPSSEIDFMRVGVRRDVDILCCSATAMHQRRGWVVCVSVSVFFGGGRFARSATELPISEVPSQRSDWSGRAEDAFRGGTTDRYRRPNHSHRTPPLPTTHAHAMKRGERHSTMDFKRCKARLGDNYNDICPICLEPLEGSSDTPIVTVCDHVMHTSCLCSYTKSEGKRWLQVSTGYQDQAYTFAHLTGLAGPQCPVCRQHLPLIDKLTLSIQNSAFKHELQRHLPFATLEWSLRAAKEVGKRHPRARS